MILLRLVDQVYACGVACGDPVEQKEGVALVVGVATGTVDFLSDLFPVVADHRKLRTAAVGAVIGEFEDGKRTDAEVTEQNDGGSGRSQVQELMSMGKGCGSLVVSAVSAVPLRIA